MPGLLSAHIDEPVLQITFVLFKNPQFLRVHYWMQIHFFTIVLNGMPFIEYHIRAFEQLKLDWHWHIMEGLASHHHDTAWCTRNGGRIKFFSHKNGLSNDGTTEYLDALKEKFPSSITLYRKPGGKPWDGKLEMVSAPLPNLPDECLLWQIDADELWTPAQINAAYQLFSENPDRTAAFFLCHFFFGPGIASSRPDVFGNFTRYEWLRLWKYKRGDQWMAHEPPTLSRRNAQGAYVDLGRLNPFMHSETQSCGLMFQHYAYATEAQVAFKESYYGYQGALESWKRLQHPEARGRRIREYLDWVKNAEIRKPKRIKSKIREWFRPSPGARAEPFNVPGIPQLAVLQKNGLWEFHV